MKRPTTAVEASPSRGNSADHMQPRGQLSGPLIAVFPVHSQCVLSADGEQALHNDVAVIPDEARIGDDGQRLANERCQTEISAQAVERWSGHVLPAEKAGEHPSDDAFAAARRADHEQDFVQIEPPGNDVAEPLAEDIDGLRLMRPQLLKKIEPMARTRGPGVVIKRHGSLIEIEWGVGVQMPRRDVEQAVADRNNCSGGAPVGPRGFLRQGRGLPG
jgi:hypothetical protein